MNNNLSHKTFWHQNWLNIKLPTKFWTDYSHQIIDNKIKKYISKNFSTCIEIGGCPGHWADYFYHQHHLISDSLDYDENNIKITQKNYQLLGVKGKVIFGDITKKNTLPNNKYDIVLSDGLIEHFKNSSQVFKNHIELLKNNGLLIIGVPNIKKSIFYNFFSKFDQKSYQGFRHITIEELHQLAGDNKLQILFCDYIGVANLGLINNKYFPKIIIIFHIFLNYFLDLFLKKSKIKTESNTFSPYIFLIAKKNDKQK